MTLADQCRSCQAPILWLKHVISGKPAPIDAEPSDEGNIRPFVQGKHYRVLFAEELADAHEVGELLHTNHYVTCPDAAEWRARRKPA